MKREQFHIPGSLLVEYQEHREGPTPVWICWKPDTAQSFTDTKKLLKFAGWPKSTPTGQKIREWITSFENVTPTKGELNAAIMKAVSWGPEVHAEEEEPNDNTKQIV